MLTLKPEDIFAENYRLIKLIGTGGFAEVWKAEFLSAENMIVALKIFSQMDEQGIKDVVKEYREQADLLHSNLLIARSFGVFNGCPYLEMRFCNGGDASGKINNCDEAEVAKCIYQIASALAYLHDEKDIIHQDIKPNNFLINDNKYYLADLGLSTKVRKTIQRLTEAKSGSKVESEKINTTGSTPPPYRAPELWDRTKQAVKTTDIWALGASVHEMINGEMPFGEWGGIMQMNNPEPPDLPGTYSAELNAIVKKCLAKESGDRPRAAQLAEWTKYYIDKGFYPKIELSVTEVPTIINPIIMEPIAPKPIIKIVVGCLATIVVIIGVVWGVNHIIGTSKQAPLTPGASVQKINKNPVKQQNKKDSDLIQKPVAPHRTIKPRPHLRLTPHIDTGFTTRDKEQG